VNLLRLLEWLSGELPALFLDSEGGFQLQIVCESVRFVLTHTTTGAPRLCMRTPRHVRRPAMPAAASATSNMRTGRPHVLSLSG